jgi:cyclophilin family peptidyl-prolyl cis-trans isomerase/3-methyladenine DNA glycosylase AlkD
MKRNLRLTTSDLLRFIAVLLLVTQFGGVTSCDQSELSVNDFSDEVMVRIHDHQDRHISDSLYQFLTHNNSTYRAKAAMAFASIQDTAAVEPLGALLEDDELDVRIAAAYALGQTGGEKAADLLVRALQQKRDTAALPIILEAIGKTAGVDEIPTTNFRSAGIPWMYYRLGLRHETPPHINSTVAQYLAPGNDRYSRLGAAHFFARSKATSIEDAQVALVNALRNDPDPDVRMASAWALRKIASKESRDALSNAALQDDDYRVRVNAVNALESFPFNETSATLLLALEDSVLQVGVAAAGTISKVAEEDDAKELVSAARIAGHWRIQAMLFQAANAGGPNLNAGIKALYNATSNPYQKAALLTALSGRDALPFVFNILVTTEIPAIRTAAAQFIVGLNYELADNVNDRTMFLDHYARGISLGDLAVTGLFTNALADSTLGFRDVVTDLSFLYEARDKFSLPRDYESYLPLERAIAFFERRDPREIDKPFSHPIDWDLVRRIPRDQQAIVKTTKGEFVIDLHIDEAPGSVANFVRLVMDGYYNGKGFHRVVSNFVVQGGCDRGDGWGSADYSIRSEFSQLRYATGSVGLASAGKDTESTQFFITHSPTPHLDGRYTIFGTVSKGMETVHQLEVSDSILSITLVPTLNPG